MVATARQIEIYNCYTRNNNDVNRTAKDLGINPSNVRRGVNNYLKWQEMDQGVASDVEKSGVENSQYVSHYWKKDVDGYSYFIKNTSGSSEDDISFTDLVKEIIETSTISKDIKLQKRYPQPSSNRLLVVDLADVHFQKLSVIKETGYTYDHTVAQHRYVEGTKALLAEADKLGFGQVLFVIGNDILHTDTPTKTTTSGTPQDVSTSLFEAYRLAQESVIMSIEECAKYAPVTVVHCMSNHDWQIGWALAQTVKAVFDSCDHPNVTFSDYGASEIHRKYVEFGNSLLVLDHGDGAKEDQILSLCFAEARDSMTRVRNVYAIKHHIHHANNKTRGVEQPLLREKDHTNLTVLVKGSPKIEGEFYEVEYMRSPSAPDGWHHRNGYINRQAVESMLFCPSDGLVAKITKFF